MFGGCYTCRGSLPFVLAIALDMMNVYLQEMNSPKKPGIVLSLYELYSICLQNEYVMSEGYHGVYNATHTIYKSLKSK